MNFVQMVTGLLMEMQQLDASSQGVSDVAIYVVLLKNRKWPTSQIRVLSRHHHFHTARWTVGLWCVKEGRREVKRYGTLFTCMASCAIHIEVAQSMETDSFLQALRCVINRRGPIRELRSEQGTNFVGVENELKRAI